MREAGGMCGVEHTIAGCHDRTLLPRSDQFGRQLLQDQRQRFGATERQQLRGSASDNAWMAEARKRSGTR